MADNRMYLVCATCGEQLYLGKSFYHGLHYTNYTPEKGTLEEKLNRFFVEHYDKHLYDDNVDITSIMLGTNFYIEHEWFGEETKNEIKNLYGGIGEYHE